MGTTNNTEKKRLTTQIKEMSPAIGIFALAFWTLLVWSWPTIKAQADIASLKDQVAMLTRLEALEVSAVATQRNQALSVVLLAELTGKISPEESRAKLVQVANGDYKNSELMNLLLNAKPNPRSEDR